MFVIIMHNNQRYLESIANLATEDRISNFTIIKRKGIGIRLLGGDASFALSRGSKVEAYERAFVGIINGEKKMKHFLEIVENDDYLERINMQDKGFVCAIPFSYVVSLLKLYSKPEK